MRKPTTPYLEPTRLFTDLEDAARRVKRILLELSREDWLRLFGEIELLKMVLDDTEQRLARWREDREAIRTRHLREMAQLARQNTSLRGLQRAPPLLPEPDDLKLLPAPRGIHSAKRGSRSSNGGPGTGSAR